MSVVHSSSSSSRSPGRHRLRIGVIGGVERNFQQLERAAESLGCEAECHPGHMHGRKPAALDALIRRVDVVVIVTDVNSHNAVIHARRVADAAGRPYVLVRRLSPSRLGALLTVLLAGDPLAGAAAAAGMA